MSGLDKIIDHITQEARNEAEKIVSAAKADADKFLAVGKEDALARVQAIKKQSGLDVSAAFKRIQSASELQEKRTVLQAKQEMIESVFEKAVEKLCTLDDEQYFEALSHMVSRYASGEKGRIILNARDAKRVPESFQKECEKANLTVSSESANISGGFILSYGDIEENCSFDVLINTSREELQDDISRLLFG